MNIKGIVNSISVSRIVISGALITSIAAFLLYAFLITPAYEDLEADKVLAFSMQQELESRILEQAQSLDSIPKSSELPRVLGFIKQYFENNGAAVSGIQITQLSGPGDNEFSQDLIRITLKGADRKMIELTGSVIKESGYPLILEELDITPSKTEIILKILTKKPVSI